MGDIADKFNKFAEKEANNIDGVTNQMAQLNRVSLNAFLCLLIIVIN